MINDAVEYIRKEIKSHLGIPIGEVNVGNIHLLKDESKTGVYISLINLEQEKTLKNLSHATKVNNQTVYLEPPVHLNLYLLFAFEFGLYSTSLLRLSQTVELFQSKSNFTADNAIVANPFPASLQKLIFDLHLLFLSL